MPFIWVSIDLISNSSASLLTKTTIDKSFFSFLVASSTLYVTINATPDGDPAHTTITGLVSNENLSVGKNEFIITVEAQNKQTQRYYVVVNRASE